MADILISPRFLNRFAWNRRWFDRQASWDNAELALKELGESGSDRLEAGRALRTLAWQAKWRGQFDKAIDLCLRAQENLKSAEAWSELADVFSIQAVVRVHLGQPELAERSVQHGFSCLSQDSRPESLIDLLTTAATLNLVEGKFDVAFDYLEKAREHATGIEISRLSQNYARFYLVSGDLRNARAHAAKGIMLCNQADNRVVLPYLYELLGDIVAQQGAFDIAQGVLTDGLRLAQSEEDKRVECRLLELLGVVGCEIGEVEVGLARLQDAAQLSEAINYTQARNSVYKTLAETYGNSGDDTVAPRSRPKTDVTVQGRSFGLRDGPLIR